MPLRSRGVSPAIFSLLWRKLTPLREEIFPGIPVVGMYGTSTTGISYQKCLEAEDDYRVVYIPSSPMIVLDPVDEEGRFTREVRDYAGRQVKEADADIIRR